MRQDIYQRALQQPVSIPFNNSNPENYVPDQQVRSGLIFIPDISGFTRLVHSTDLLTGKQITYELLSSIIGENNLELNISEVEGDAILFYRYGAAPGIGELMDQYQKMVRAFENKRAALEDLFSRSLNVSLKVIAHYGPISEFTIGNFKKLYGKVVVEAHRLLKNSMIPAATCC